MKTAYQHPIIPKRPIPQPTATLSPNKHERRGESSAEAMSVTPKHCFIIKRIHIPKKPFSPIFVPKTKIPPSTRFAFVPLDFFPFLRDNKAGNSSVHPFYLREVHGDADFSGRNR